MKTKGLFYIALIQIILCACHKESEVVKQIDGDYNFLFCEGIDKPVKESNLKSLLKTTFRDVLKQNGTSLKNGTDENYYDVIFENIKKEKPLLQIAIPEIYEGSTETWKTDEDILVAYLPDDYDEKTTKVICAYDRLGNRVELNAKIEPVDPVIVISENERFVAVPVNRDETGLKKALLPYFENEHFQYYLKEDYYYTGSGYSNGGASSNSKSAQYDREKNDGRDVLLKARFVSKEQLRSVESWVKGKPEMKVFVIFAQTSAGQTSLSTTKKYIGSKNWYHRNWLKLVLDTKSINIPIITWDRKIYGDIMKYAWYEEDGGGTIESEIVLSHTHKINDDASWTAKTTIKLNKRDLEAGDAIVNYTEATSGDGTEYNTGILRFWINQEK